MIAYTSGTTGPAEGRRSRARRLPREDGLRDRLPGRPAPRRDALLGHRHGLDHGPVGDGRRGLRRRDRGPLRGRARLARARSRLGVGRAAPGERAGRLADADPRAQDRRATSTSASTTSRACGSSARPASRGTPSPTAGSPRWSAAGALPIINISGGTEVGACFLTPYPVEEIKVCSLGGAVARHGRRRLRPARATRSAARSASWSASSPGRG